MEASAQRKPGRVDDRELIRRFRAGDREAFTAIYGAHSGDTFRFALRMTCDEAKATEVVQDVFVWLIHHAEAFDPERGELGAFLRGVARKFLLRLYTAEKRWVPLDTRDYAAAEQTDSGDGPAALRVAIRALPLRYREVVVACDLEEKSYAEVAAELGCPVGTVRSRLHRARELLAGKLGAVRKKETQCPV